MKTWNVSSVRPIICASFFLSLVGALAQTTSPPLVHPVAATAPTAVPALVPYSGEAIASDGKPLSGDAAVTFLIFNDAQGGEPLFTETQTVAPDLAGHYKVQLGASFASGIPLDLFSTGEARWLEVQIAGQPAQPRVLLASVPYALKAADATTLGGLPASAFALAGTKNVANALSPAITPDLVTDVTTTGGTSGYVPVFNGASTVVDSPVFVSGANVGIGTATPSQTLDVNGPTAFRGNANLFWKGAATRATGANSESLSFSAEAYNSSTKSLFRPYFSLLSEAAGNNTASPSATLNLQFGNGTTLVETGLYISSNGAIHFAPGQTLPGADVTGSISATSVNANSYDLGGSPFAFGSQEFQTVYFGFAGNSSTSGLANTAVGFKALTANTTGLYNAANGAQALISNTSGSYNTANGYLALANNNTGSNNVADGAQALLRNTIGFLNTADGDSVLSNNTTGDYNTADGDSALNNNTTGSYNTAVGTLAGPDNNSTNLSSSTAIGANAVVSESNALVLGQTTAGSPGATHVNVGIGTPTPRSILEASVGASSGLGPALTLTNTAGGLNAAASIDFNTYYHSAVPYKNPTSRIEALDDNDYGNTLAFLSKLDGADTNGLVTNMTINDNGDVAIRGSLSAAVKNFKIDHPLDPANKYLVHSSVESSEMMNIYSGNVTTDELGLATVKLPDWFEAENTDFRYQLTVVDERFAQAVVSRRIENNQFTIHTNASNVEVSWQITAVRQDAYAKANPLVVEQAKPASERGFTSESLRLLHDQPASAVNRNFTHPTAPAIHAATPGAQLKPISQVETK